MWHATVVRILLPVAWFFWTGVLIAVLYGVYLILTETTHSPEAGPGLGGLLVAFLLLLMAGSGFLLWWAANRQLTGVVVGITVVMAYVGVSLVAQPLVKKYKERAFERELAKSGSFSNPELQALAQAIRTGDAVQLQQLLKGQPPPAGKDAAGQDLLTFAIATIFDAKHNPECVRVLLEAGADARALNAAENPVRLMLFYNNPESAETLRLLLAHGADPNAFPLREGDNLEVVRMLVEAGANMNAKDEGGMTPLLHFISTRKWDIAQYLVEKGADLSAQTEHGLSVDYYLKDWKDSVYGEHPPEWDRLREAINKRR